LRSLREVEVEKLQQYQQVLWVQLGFQNDVLSID